MFRWLAVTVTLCVVAVVVGVLSAGLPTVEKAQDKFSPPFEGVKLQPPAPRPVLHAMAGEAVEERIDETLPISVVQRAVVPICQISSAEAQEVPARHDGEILVIGTEIQPGERVAEIDRINNVDMVVLAIERKNGEIVPEAEGFKDQRYAKYRRFRDGDPIEPDTLKVVKETRQFRRLKQGMTVKAGQLVGMINPDIASDELAAAVARLNGGEAKRAASAKTRDEAKVRADRMLELHQLRAVSLEEYQGAVLTYERYRYEEIENMQGINTARNDLSKSLTNLRLHEIRARIPGAIKTIYKNYKGEAVKGLEKGADTVMVIQNPALLKIDGQVEIQYAHLFKPGMEVVVEPIQRANYEQAFHGHLQEITGVAVSKNNLIVSASGENAVFMWDRSIEHQAKGMLNHPTQVFAVGCSPLKAKENLCLTGGADGVGRLWNLDGLTAKNTQARKPERELSDRSGHHKPINCVAFSPKGDMCATGGSDAIVCVWETDSGKLLHVLTGHRSKVTSVQFASDNELVSAGGDNSLILWDLKNEGKPVKRMDSRGGEVTTLGVHPSGKEVLFDQGKELRLLSLPGFHSIGVLQNSSGAMPFTTMALFSPDGNLILTNGAADGRMQVWRTPTSRTRGYELSRLIWGSPATCGAFAPDGSFVVTGTKDNYVLIWPLPPREMIEKQFKATIISVDTSLENSSGIMVHAEMENPKDTITGQGLLYTEDKATLVLYPESK